MYSILGVTEIVVDGSMNYIWQRTGALLPEYVTFRVVLFWPEVIVSELAGWNAYRLLQL